MRIKLNIGAVSVSVVKPEYMMETRTHVATDGVRLDVPITLQTESCPAEEKHFTMGESSFEFECEVGELAEIYKVIGPELKEVMLMAQKMRAFS